MDFKTTSKFSTPLDSRLTTAKPKEKGTKLEKAVSKVLKRSQMPKVCDFGAFNASGVTTTGTIVHCWDSLQIADPAGGPMDSPNVRVSDRILADAMEVRGGVIVGDETNFVRLIVVRWPDNPGTQSFNVADVISNYSSSSITRWSSPYAWLTKPTFEVLYDQTFGVSTAGPQCLPFSFRLDLGGMEVVFDEGTMAQGTSKNTLDIVAVSDSSILPNPVLTVSCRIWFRDAL